MNICNWTKNSDYWILQESEIIEQIDRDVKRTHPEMEFFNGDSSDSLSNQVGVSSDMRSPFRCHLHCFLFPLWSVLFSGVTEAYTYHLCKIKSGYKICTRNEWGFGTSLLCFQEWSRWRPCCECPYVTAYLHIETRKCGHAFCWLCWWNNRWWH